MKTYLTILGLIVSLSCSSQSDKESHKKDVDSSFAKFISKFADLQLPLDIYHSNKFGKYDDKIFKEVNGKIILVPNPLCPTIPITDYKYFKDKYPINKNCNYSVESNIERLDLKFAMGSDRFSLQYQ